MHCEIFDKNEIKKEEWNKVATFSKLPFASYEYLESLDHVKCIICRLEGEIVGGVAFRERSFNILGLAFFKSIWVEMEIAVNNNVDNYHEIKLSIIKILVNYASRNKIIQINFNHWCREVSIDVFESQGFVVNDIATFEVNIASVDDVWGNLKSKVRTKINKGSKLLSFESFEGEKLIEHLERFIDLRDQTYIRAKSKNNKSSIGKKSKSFIEILAKKFSDKIILFSAKKDEIHVAMALVMIKGSSAVWYLGGSDSRYNKYQHSIFLQWEIIKYLHNRNVTVYDLGGVPYQCNENDPGYGVFMFKKTIGGNLMTYYSGNKIINTFSYFLFNKLKGISLVKKVLGI